MKKTIWIVFLTCSSMLMADQDRHEHQQIAPSGIRTNEARPAPPRIEVLSHPAQIEQRVNRPQNPPMTQRPQAPFQHEYRAPSRLFYRGESERRFANRDEFVRFHAEDFQRWNSGRWIEGRIHGAFGWYWFIPGLGYYYYAQPVFPAPDPYAFYQHPESAVFYDENTPPEVTYSQPQNQPDGYWYFCRSSNAYYPYVSECAEEWEKVLATK